MGFKIKSLKNIIKVILAKKKNKKQIAALNYLFHKKEKLNKKLLIITIKCFYIVSVF